MNPAITNHGQAASAPTASRPPSPSPGGAAAGSWFSSGHWGPWQQLGSGSEGRTLSHFCPGTADISPAKEEPFKKLVS